MHIFLTVQFLRWYKDATLDVTEVRPVTRNHAQRVGEMFETIPPHLLSNPLGSVQTTSTPIPTQTIGSRTVFHGAQMALRPLLNNIQTQEQLDDLMDKLDGIRFVQNNNISISCSKDVFTGKKTRKKENANR